jgi:phage shock protein PspC (stress-responsive transcriptional regulator)
LAKFKWKKLKNKKMEKKLYRNESDKVLGGVASGLADYLNLDVTIVRVGFLLLFFFGGSGFLIYIIMWIVVPAKKNFSSITDYRVYEEPDYVKPVGDISQPQRDNTGTGRFWVGPFLVILGLYFLFHEFNFIPYWISLEKLWPLIFIIPGIIILSNARKKEDRREEENYTIRRDSKSNTQEPDVNPSDSSTNPTNTNSSINPNTNPEQPTNDTL